MWKPFAFLLGIWRKLDGSLRARLLVPVLLGAVASSSLMVVTAAELHSGDLEQATRERSTLFATLATDATVSHMSTYEHSDVSELLAALKAHRPDIESLSILGLDGHVGASTNPSARGHRPWRLSELEQRNPIQLPGNQGFVVIRPIPNDERCASCHVPRSGPNGWMELRFSNASLRAAKNRLWGALALAEVPSVLLLVGIAWLLLGREAINPIQRLVRAMQRAAAGDRTAKADEGRPDEIGLAARRFDATMEALHQSQAELAKMYAKHMERADRFAMVGQMATGLAHEIKNPLAGLSGALELLAEDVASNPQQSEVVQEMRHQVDRLAGIMEGLLHFARPPKAQPQRTDVNASVEKVFFLVGRQKNRAGVRFVKELAPNLPTVWADPGHLEQVFLNIALNGFQVMEQTGGTLTVRTRAEGTSVVVEIADTGPGIPEAVRPNIFTPFFTTRANGTGMGLALSNRLVAEHGGTLEFRCPESGGTVFTVTLPVEGARAAVAPAQQPVAQERVAG